MNDNFFEPALINDEYFYISWINPFFYEGNEKKEFDVCILVSSESAFGSRDDLLEEISKNIVNDEDFSWLTVGTSLKWTIGSVEAINSYEEYQTIIKLIPHRTLFVEQNFC